MGQKELPSFEPHLLQPEYWDGHGPEDDCEWKEVWGRRDKISLRQELKASGFGKDTLRDFFSLEVTPVRAFADGELFDASQHPEGAIIKYEQEKLHVISDFKYYEENPYRRRDYYGVVCGYDYEGARKTILVRFPAYDPPINFFPLGLLTSLTIRVKDVEHVRVNRKDYKSEVLRRVNGLVLYKIGKGVREKEKNGFRLPNFGVIFGRKPQTQT